MSFRDTERQAASTVTMTSSQGGTQHSPEYLTGSTMVFSERWESPHSSSPPANAASPSDLPHMSHRLKALPMTKHPRHGIANKNSVRRTSQREGQVATTEQWVLRRKGEKKEGSGKGRHVVN